MDSSGQTTFEYLLLVGGVVVLALVVVYMLTQSAQSAGKEVNATTHTVVSEINRKATNIVKNLPG